MNARVMDQYRRLKGFIGTVVQHVAFGQSAGLRHNLAVQVGRKQLVAAAPPLAAGASIQLNGRTRVSFRWNIPTRTNFLRGHLEFSLSNIAKGLKGFIGFTKNQVWHANPAEGD